MDNFYLQELIEETHNRGGGLILNYDDKPAVVVLSVEKYNQLISQTPENVVSPFMGSSAADKSAHYSKEKILVTGGAGYIGAHAADQLVKQGYQVTILDNLSSGKRENIPPPKKTVAPEHISGRARRFLRGI